MDVSDLLEQLVVSHDDFSQVIHSSPEPPLLAVSISEHETSSIHSLPVELLETIFTMTHRDWLLSTIRPQLLAINPATPRNSTVCRLWRDIITTTAHFLTGLVIPVDYPASLKRQLSLFLKRSRLVAIVRRSYDLGYDANERWRVAAVMDVLGRKLSRFQDIYFHVN